MTLSLTLDHLPTCYDFQHVGCGSAGTAHQVDGRCDSEDGLKKVNGIFYIYPSEQQFLKKSTECDCKNM